MSPLGLAWANLSHHRVRTLIAVVGVGFAVLLIFMQFGFYGAVKKTATMLFDHLDFDLLVVSSEHQDLTRRRDIPRERLAQVRAVPGVRDALPMSMGAGAWRNPDVPRAWYETGPEPGSASSITILGVPPGSLNRMFRNSFDSPAAAEADGIALAELDTVLIDRLSRPEFGSYEFLRSLPPDPAGPRFNGMRVSVVGDFSLGSGFSWKGMLIASEETANRLTYRPADRITLGLIGLEPGADPEAVRSAILATLPTDVRVLTPDEAKGIETDYWIRGNTFGELAWAGVLLALVVGVIFLYQMMSADIRNQLSEYATAKALGYRPGYLRSVVLWQAALLAVLGYIPGILGAAVLYQFTAIQAGLPMALDPSVAVGVLILTVGMCVGSGLMAVRKVHSADPANLF